MIIFGPLLVVLVIFFPRGITGQFLSWMHHKAQAMQPRHKARASKVTAPQEARNNA